VAPCKRLVESPDILLRIIKGMRESPLVESPDILLRIIKGMRESPLVESPCKLYGKKALDKGLQKKVSLRNIDSMFPINDTKMFSHNFYLSKRERQVDDKLA
jgi:hypothetical protein